MDINLILSAQTLCLAPQLKRSELKNGLFVLKNIPAMSYLRVTPEQWIILAHFEKPQMVPAVLGTVIRDRQCLPLGEFFELILKALHANILLEPGVGPEPVRAYEWNWAIRPSVLSKPLAILFCAGIVLALAFHPNVPLSYLDAGAGLLLLCAALSFGDFLAGCMIRGSGGEVYRPRWRWLAIPPHFALDKGDAVMLSSEAQMLVALAVPSMLATAAGIASWYGPGWAFFPVLGLLFSVRPVFGGRVASLFHVGSKRALSESEESHSFPPNRRPDARARLLSRTLQQPTTWVRVLYAVLWTFATLYWVLRLKQVPTVAWITGFLQANGVRIAVGVGGSLVVLGVAYLAWEIYRVARESARSRRTRLRQWYRRWFSRAAAMPDESTRMKAISSSAVFNALQPPERQEMARVMAVRRHGPWKQLPESSGVPTEVSLIVSGKISVRRVLASGRSVQVQVLSEGDIIGLHDLADPSSPSYQLRTLTPVTLLTTDRAKAEQVVVRRVPQALLTDMLLKLPFLRQISLCRNWHLQAIKRFARLSTITAYDPEETILSEGQAVEDFFIIFQGDAQVNQGNRQLAVVHSGEFFGEIGLMQNSSPSASVTARNGTRCLSISRTELLRFVTHNYTVALELERVSSERLGRPLFPLKPGDFRGI
jgi:CRP-like cAMP-binding protein